MVLKGSLRLAKTFRNYDFYNIVLLNIACAVSMCDEVWDVAPVDYSKLCQRKMKLMAGIRTLTDQLGISDEFEQDLSAFKYYSRCLKQIQLKSTMIGIQLFCFINIYRLCILLFLD